MKNKIIIPMLFLVLFFTACSNKSEKTTKEGENQSPAEAISKKSGWYYFSESGIHSADNPSAIPSKTFKPWTEAVRVADATIALNAPCLLINKIGLLTTNKQHTNLELHSDSFFSELTAGGLYKTDYGLSVRLYRNSFFKDADNIYPSFFLAYFDEVKQNFALALSPRDLNINEQAQCVALDRIGSRWYASFKTVTEGKTEFTYLEFDNFPQKKSDSLEVTKTNQRKINMETYQYAVAPQSWKNAPDQLQDILSQIPESFGLNIKAYSRSYKSTQTFVRNASEQSLDGTAWISDDSTAILFADGTFYYKDDNSSNTLTTLKLPLLSQGYVYTWFAISGNTLLAAWEEQRFYEIGRAGLFETELPKK